MAQEQAEADAHHDWLSSPDVRAERIDSRTAFDDLPSAAAIATLTDTFGDVVSSLDWIGSRLARADDYEAFRSDTVAAIDLNGHRQLIDSSVPLRAPDDQGHVEPVDLTLEPSGPSFVPSNPLVDLTLPSDIGHGITVGEGAHAVRLVPVAGSEAADGVAVNHVGVAWANTATDTDVLAAPVPTGVETFAQLRSPDAPEQWRLRVESASDVDLMPSAGGVITVWSGGQPVGAIQPPSATDAQGRDIPVTMTTEGDDVVLTVRHRGMDVAYPILVDPLYEDWFHSGTSGGSWYRGDRAGLENWIYAENPAGWYPHGTHCVGSTDCYGSTGDGLYMYSYAGLGYGSGHYSEWYYRPYEWNIRSTYINRVEFGYQYNEWHGGAANFGLVDGIFSGTGWTGIIGLGSSSTPLYTVVRAGDNATDPTPARGKAAVFAAMPTQTTHPAAGTYYTGSAVVFLEDLEAPSNPSVSHSATPPSGWTSSFSDRVSFSSSDAGLGVLAFNVFTDGGAWTSWQPTVNGAAFCQGVNAYPCAPSGSGYYDYSAQSLGTGIHQMTVCAYDPTLKGACANAWTVKVDRTGPQAAVSGTSIGTGGGTLTVNASDPHSGVRQVIVSTTNGDGASVEIGRANVACGATDCPHDAPTQSIPLNPIQLQWGAGAHTVTVVSNDFLGNPSVQNFTVTLTAPSAASVCADTFSDDAAGFRVVCLHEQNGDGDETATAAAIATDEEIACATVWWRCRQWYADSKTSLKMTERLFVGKAADSDSTVANSFQHSFWVAQMVNSTDGSNVEVRGALALAIAHEAHQYDSSTQYIRNRSRMDVLNNRTGWQVGKDERGHTDFYLCNLLFDKTYAADYIGATTDPYAYWENYGLGQLIYRKLYTYGAAHVHVEPTGLDCTGANS